MLAILIIVAIVSNTQHTTQKKINGAAIKNTNNQQLSPTTTPSATWTPIPTIVPTEKIMYSPYATQTNAAQQGATVQYPNSQQTNSSGNTIYYESTDSPNAITDWYKTKIKSMGMNTTSFIQNNSNNNVLNQLIGSDGRRNIRVEITKPAGENIAKIAVTVSNS